MKNYSSSFAGKNAYLKYAVMKNYSSSFAGKNGSQKYAVSSNYYYVFFLLEKTEEGQLPAQLLCLLFLGKPGAYGQNNYYVFFFLGKIKKSHVCS